MRNAITFKNIYTFHLLQRVPRGLCSFSFSPMTTDLQCDPFRVFIQRKYYNRSGQDTLRTRVPRIDDELAESLRVLAELQTGLPTIPAQESGRRKVRAAT
jgi:hypothetical protein